MKYTLSMNPSAWSGEGSALHHGEVIGYDVGGMPTGEIGSVFKHQTGEWKFRRMKAAKEMGDFIGPFDTPDAALAGLQAEIDSEQRICICVKWYPYYFGDLMICNVCHHELSPEKLALTIAFWREHKPRDFLHDEMYNVSELEARFGNWLMANQRP